MVEIAFGINIQSIVGKHVIDAQSGNLQIRPDLQLDSGKLFCFRFCGVFIIDFAQKATD